MFFFLLILIVLAAFLLFVSRKPNEFALSRSTVIAAPATEIFPWINNMKRFNQWNPWANVDPTSTMTYSGPEEGPNASHSWMGKKVGEGSMTLSQQTPPTDVAFALEFLKPFRASNIASFNLEPSGAQTKVTWTMTGRNSFFNKLFQTFVSMDKMVGKDFDKGLASLKQLVESRKLS
jgi:Polyketide cyclase / dehydrase and lipid transport